MAVVVKTAGMKEPVFGVMETEAKTVVDFDTCGPGTPGFNPLHGSDRDLSIAQPGVQQPPARLVQHAAIPIAAF